MLSIQARTVALAGACRWRVCSVVTCPSHHHLFPRDVSSVVDRAQPHPISGRFKARQATTACSKRCERPQSECSRRMGQHRQRKRKRTARYIVRLASFPHASPKSITITHGPLALGLCWQRLLMRRDAVAIILCTVRRPFLLLPHRTLPASLKQRDRCPPLPVPQVP